MVQNPDQVERLYADAISGDQRATRTCLELEQYFWDIGVNVAEKAAGLDCILLPPLCAPDWGFLGFLSRTRPGGVRLRNIIKDGFQTRARALALQNKLVLNMINLLMAGVIVSRVSPRVGVSEQALEMRPLSSAQPTRLPAAISTEAASMAATVSTTTKLYRAVSEAELRQLLETGQFHQGPNALGGKWFAESAADAVTWGERLNGPGNFRVIEVELPKSVADKLPRRPRLDSIGPARYAELEQLDGAVVREVK
jgi:hypothetical protein